ncbi:MAG: VWA domain-containing protein [Chloroflexi bacterium]|nr:VWA domain-containing protein [Chloroflexota bacterium]
MKLRRPKNLSGLGIAIILALGMLGFYIGLWTSTPVAARPSTADPAPATGSGSVRLPAGRERLLAGPPIRLPTGTDAIITLLSENFEGAWPSANWTVFDNDVPSTSNGEYYWANRCAGRNSSRSAWAIGGGANGSGLTCGANYPNLVDSWTIYGPIDFSQVVTAELSFAFWVNSECVGCPNNPTKLDRLWAMASTDGANFNGFWWAGPWNTDPRADANGWINTPVDLNSLAGQQHVWIAFNFESDSSTVFPEGAKVDDVLIRASTNTQGPTPTPTATTCPVTAHIQTLSTDRTCYVPGSQMGVFVNATTSLASQSVRAQVLVLSGDIAIASATQTFTAPGQQVIPVQIPANPITGFGDYSVLVNLYDANSNCLQETQTRTVRIDPSCGSVTPGVSNTPTHTPTATATATATRTASPTPIATNCPGAGTTTYITTDDNENNAHTGVPDNDMYPANTSCIYNDNTIAPIEFNIIVPSLPSFATARLLLYAYDVDEQDGERDEVYFNGQLVGTLTGDNNKWSTSVFDINPTLVRSNKNLVEIRIDVNNPGTHTWCTEIDWGQLVLGHGGGAASIRSATLDSPTSCYVPNSTVTLVYEIDTTLPQQEVRVEVNILDANNNTITSSSRTYTTNDGQNDPKTEVLQLPPGLATGTYKIEIIVFDTCSNTQQDIWTSTFRVDPSCGTATPTQTATATATPSRTATRTTTATATVTPTATTCVPPRPPVTPSCPGPNFVRNFDFEKFNRSWGEYSSTGQEIVNTRSVAQGFYAAYFEGPLGRTSDQILYQYVDIPLDATNASFWVGNQAHGAAQSAGNPPTSGQDYFRVSLYNATFSTELVRLWQFNPLSPCPIDPDGYNLTADELNLVRGHTVALVFELRKVTAAGWTTYVMLDRIHFDVCSPSPACNVVGNKTASPNTVPPGGEVTVMLSLTGLEGNCLPSRKPADVMLVLDRSGSMQGQPIIDAKTSAKGFVDRLDLSTDQVGLVTFSDTATLDQMLTQSAGPVRTAIDNQVAFGSTNIGDALLLGQGELASGRHKAANQPVLILMSDGLPNTGSDSRAAAAAAKAAGTRIFTIGLGNGVDPNLMRDLASAPTDYFFAPDSSQLDAIYQQIAGAIGGSPATNITIVDRLSPYVTLVPNSFTGAPTPDVSADGRTLTWHIPRLGFETPIWSYRVNMTQTPGTWPTNDSATATYTNSQGQPGALTFPVPMVTVVKPEEHSPAIMCRDNLYDDGSVPSNTKTDIYWESPDIWVRNQPDGSPVNQNPIVGQVNTIYVRVTNKGNGPATNITVHIYDTKGAANLRWPDDWVPELGVVHIPTLLAGQSVVVSLPWTPVYTGHYCFLSRIESPDDPITFDGWVPFDRHICQHNVQIIDSPTSATGLGVGNRGRASGYGSVTVNSANFPAAGSGTVTFTDPALFQRWQQAGGTVSGGQVISGTRSIRMNVQPGTSAPSGPDALDAVNTAQVNLVIDRIPFEAEEVSTLTFQVNGPPGSAPPTLQVAQLVDGKAVGGNSISPAVPVQIYLPRVSKR